MSKSPILPLIAGAGLAYMSGGASTPLFGVGASGGAGATGLAAQGATGLLGSAGATAAGYGAPAAGLGILPEISGEVASEALPSLTADVGGEMMTSFGPNNEYWGKAIEQGGDVTANAYTGGFDNLNGFERVGQRVEGFMDGGGMDNLGKFKNAFAGQQQQPQQQPQNSEYHGPVAQQGQQQDAGMTQVYGQSPQQLASLEELLRQRMGGYYG